MHGRASCTATSRAVRKYAIAARVACAGRPPALAADVTDDRYMKVTPRWTFPRLESRGGSDGWMALPVLLETKKR